MIVNDGGGGKRIPDLTNPAAAGDIRSGKQTVDEEGEILIGTMPTVTQPTPAITVSSSGLITAKGTQSTSGYVASGTKTATKQLTTQSGKTITPGTSQQTAVASGRYTSGNVLVAGSANLKAENIKSGVKIFNVTGTAEVLGPETTVTVQIDQDPTGGGIRLWSAAIDVNYSSSDTPGTFTNFKCKVGENILLAGWMNSNVDAVVFDRTNESHRDGFDLLGYRSLYETDTLIEMYLLRCTKANPKLHLMVQ